MPLRDLYTTIRAAAEIGDAAAVDEGRLDLRTAPTERRNYSSVQHILARYRPGAIELIGRNAVAAMDGDHLVVLGEDGRASTDPQDVPEDVLSAARAHLAASFSDSSQRVLPPLDSETRARLRELGYVE